MSSKRGRPVNLIDPATINFKLDGSIKVRMDKLFEDKQITQSIWLRSIIQQKLEEEGY